jgi:hypothetical protein
MATVFEECITEKQRSVVRFFGEGRGIKGLNANDIHKEMIPVYGGKCRVKRFSAGSRNSLKNVRNSQMMPDHVALLRLQQKQLCSGWRIAINSVVTALGCAHDSAYGIMHDRLKFRKACARWVPRKLKDREKNNRIGLALQHLLRHADEGEGMLNRTFTGDESWVHHYKPEP